jgi:hypothetical protein
MKASGYNGDILILGIKDHLNISTPPLHTFPTPAHLQFDTNVYPLVFTTSKIKIIHKILKDCKTYVTNGPII